MNPHVPSRVRILAFTLIELITVIAIIAILMALLVPYLNESKNHARRVKAKTVLQSIVNSSKAYANDYGKYPPVAAALNGGTDGYYSYGESTAHCRVNNNELFDVLRAIDRGANAQHTLNKRQQRYFEDSTGATSNPPREGFADGPNFQSSIQGQLLDPWGKQYCVVLDANDDGVLKLSEFFSDITHEIRQPAVAFCLGKDGEIGGKGYTGRLRKAGSSEPPDDVVTWE